MQTFDYLQQFDEVKQSNEVAIINIGEKSPQHWGQYPMAETELCTDDTRFTTEECWYNRAEYHVSREGSIWRRRDSSELDQRKRDSFVPTSFKGILSSRSHIGTGTIGSQINPNPHKWP